MTIEPVPFLVAVLIVSLLCGGGLVWLRIAEDRRTSDDSGRSNCCPQSGSVRRRVAICGSMSALEQMREARDELSRLGFEALIPEPDEIASGASVDDLARIKREASLSYFDHIRDFRTVAVLVVNPERDGEVDYIGPNTFAEIAVAVSAGRGVYLLHGAPLAYADELRAWGAIELRGDVAALSVAFSGVTT